MIKKPKILITTIGGLTSPDLIKALRNNGEREVELLQYQNYFLIKNYEK